VQRHLVPAPIAEGDVMHVMIPAEMADGPTNLRGSCGSHQASGPPTNPLIRPRLHPYTRWVDVSRSRRATCQFKLASACVLSHARGLVLPGAAMRRQADPGSARRARDSGRVARGAGRLTSGHGAGPAGTWLNGEAGVSVPATAIPRCIEVIGAASRWLPTAGSE
jgi:hypothetical protein